jgi:hypothetical protein
VKAGHCKKRKIRCLLAPEDPAGRCSNCIRLKKECTFYPVAHKSDMPQVPAISSRSSSAVQPATPGATLPQYGNATGAFRTQFSGPASNGQPLSFGYHGEHVSNPHCASVGSGYSSCVISTFPTLANQAPASYFPYGYPYGYPTEAQRLPANRFLPSSTAAESPSWHDLPYAAISTYNSESNVSSGRTSAAMSTSSTKSYSHGSQQAPLQLPTPPIPYGNIGDLPYQHSDQGLDTRHEHDLPISLDLYPTAADSKPSMICTNTVGASKSPPLSTLVIPSHSCYSGPWSSYDGVLNYGPQALPSARVE